MAIVKWFLGEVIMLMPPKVFRFRCWHRLYVGRALCEDVQSGIRQDIIDRKHPCHMPVRVRKWDLYRPGAEQLPI
jgi:hypothetical protein